jgi:hypothetical protein
VPLLVELFLAEVVIAAEVAVGDRAGLVDPAVVHEPTRRLGQPEAGGERDERRDDAGGEHPPPREAAELDEGVRDDDRDEVAPVPGDEHPGEPSAAPVGGGELREQGRAEGVLGADRHSQQEPHHHQLPRLGDHRLQQAEHDERGDVDREQGAAADPVGEPCRAPPRGATLSRSEQLRTASRYANMPRSTYCMMPPLR